jgi:hypothetical protein
MHEMDNINKLVYKYPHDFLESLEICIRFSTNSLLVCCVAMCANGTETPEDTQTRALSDQFQC